MKKSLFAIAAVTAFAGAAQAQSSVTVYGILDVGFAGTSLRSDTAKTNATSFSGTGSETTSRLGFRGTEDLGGGTTAFFTAEFGLSPTEYNLSGNTSGGLFNRQTFVGLSQKGIGRAAIGTQYMPIHIAVGATDPGQQNNMLGNVIYATNASQGSGNTTASYTIRVNNSITLQTERIAGFQLSGIYNNSNSDTNQGATAGGNTNNTAWGLGANYTWQKLLVNAAYQTTKQISDTGATQAAAALPATASQTVTPNLLGTSIGSNEMYAGATYDFGILKAYAQYISRKVTSNLDSNSYVKRTAQQIGVRAFVTPKIETWVSGGTGRYTGTNAGTVSVGAPTMNFTGYQLGTNYWLSKRTNMYGIFGSTQTSSATGVAAEGGSSYGVGVRHTF